MSAKSIVMAAAGAGPEGPPPVESPQFLAVFHDTTPYVTVYNWSTEGGFGTKFSNPAVLGANHAYAGTVSPDSQWIAVGSYSTSPLLNVYAWTSSGFGTRYANPMVLSAGNYITDVAFRHDSSAIAYGLSVSPFIAAYPWSASGFGTRVSNPATLPTSAGLRVRWAPDGAAVGVCHIVSPFTTMYPWTGSGFGTKYANPSTALPSSAGNGFDFTPDGSAVIYRHGGSAPNHTAYAWSSATGFGAKFANAPTVPGAGGVHVHPYGTAVALGSATSPYMHATGWSSSGWGSVYSNPTTAAPAAMVDVKFSPTGTAVAGCCSATPFVVAYKWSSSGFGTKYSNPATLPAGNGRKISFGTMPA